jgi:hypothetical protein
MKMKTQQLDIPKVVLSGKFRAMRTYIRKFGRSLINNLMMHLKPSEKQEQPNPKTNRWKDTIKIRS